MQMYDEIICDGSYKYEKKAILIVSLILAISLIVGCNKTQEDRQLDEEVEVNEVEVDKGVKIEYATKYEEDIFGDLSKEEIEAKFNTPYIHVNNRNRYSSLLGAENFYLDIYNALNSDNRILEVLEIEKQKAIEETKAKLEEISKYKVCLYSSSLGILPAQIKKYKEEYKLDIPYIVLEITDIDIENMNVDKETIDKLYKRIYESISTYTKDSIFLINSTQDKIEKLKEKVAVLGCDPKADSTRCIVNRKIPTVLDQLKNKVESDISFKGYKDIICIESGGPEPGLGCSGRGVMTAIEQIERRNILGC